jgi:hypothetical protein
VVVIDAQSDAPLIESLAATDSTATLLLLEQLIELLW